MLGLEGPCTHTAHSIGVQAFSDSNHSLFYCHLLPRACSYVHVPTCFATRVHAMPTRFARTVSAVALALVCHVALVAATCTDEQNVSRDCSTAVACACVASRAPQRHAQLHAHAPLHCFHCSLALPHSTPSAPFILASRLCPTAHHRPHLYLYHCSLHHLPHGKYLCILCKLPLPLVGCVQTLLARRGLCANTTS